MQENLHTNDSQAASAAREIKTTTSTPEELIAQFITRSEFDLFETSGTSQKALFGLAQERAKRAKKQTKAKADLPGHIVEKLDFLVSLVPGKVLWPACMVAKVFEHNGWYKKVDRPNGYGDAMGLKGLDLPKVGSKKAYHLKSIGATPEEKADVQRQLDSASKDALKLITVQESDLNLESQA